MREVAMPKDYGSAAVATIIVITVVIVVVLYVAWLLYTEWKKG